MSGVLHGGAPAACPVATPLAIGVAAWIWAAAPPELQVRFPVRGCTSKLPTALEPQVTSGLRGRLDRWTKVRSWGPGSRQGDQLDTSP